MEQWQKDDIIIEEYPTGNTFELANKLGCKPENVRCRAHLLGVKKVNRTSCRKKSNKLNEFFKKRYANMSNKEIEEITGLNARQIINRAQRLGLRKSNDHIQKMNRETPKNAKFAKWNDFLRENYAGMTNRELSNITGMTLKQLQSKASWMGLKKSKGTISRMAREKMMIRYDVISADKKETKNISTLTNKT